MALVDVYEASPLRAVRGQGCWVVAEDGRRWLDLWGGHAVALLGHAHPRLVAALARQAEQLIFQSNAVGMAVREQAAARVIAFGPPGLDRVFFVNSGAEANENALRIALRLTGRPRVVAVAGGFHGRTAAAGAVSAGRERWYGFTRAPFEVTEVPFDDERALAEAVGDDVAAVILEPVQGVAGARAMSTSFVRRARQASSAAGALLVVDEVQCGMGRTGTPFAVQAYGVTPDVMTLAKGLGGGFPVGAVVMPERIAATLGPGSLGSTFGGGPLAAAMVIATIATIEEEDLLARVRRVSERLRRDCLVGPVQAVEGMGLLIGLRTVRPAKEVVAALAERAILAGGASDPHVVRLLPPLVLGDAEVDVLVAALKEIPC